MPSGNHAKVRVLLKEGKAEVINRCPFTIKLLYDTTSYTQNISLGIDAGSKHVGTSATDEKTVYFESETELRNDIVNLLSSKREMRRSRRNRKTRYRKPRFDNRKRKEGWLAPSVQNKIDSHIAIVSKAVKMLPISRITVEVASFDLQKLKADIEKLKHPEGTEYQQGEQLGFWNVREYVLFRDNYTCQCCKGRSKDKILNVHHIQSRKIGGDAPNNLITLCEYCHTQYHKGNIKLPERIKRGAIFKDATFMGIMRWSFYNRLKEIYRPLGIEVKLTYGYITKNTRIKNELPKEHYVDARCISGNPKAVSDGIVYKFKKVRCHNRQIHKCSIEKGGVRKLNQAPKVVKGFQLFDKVRAKGREWYIHGRRIKGSFVLKDLHDNVLEITPGKIKLIRHQRGFISEWYKALLS